MNASIKLRSRFHSWISTQVALSRSMFTIQDFAKAFIYLNEECGMQIKLFEILKITFEMMLPLYIDLGIVSQMCSYFGSSTLKVENLVISQLLPMASGNPLLEYYYNSKRPNKTTKRQQRKGALRKLVRSLDNKNWWPQPIALLLKCLHLM